jgi:hypothetical protein
MFPNVLLTGTWLKFAVKSCKIPKISLFLKKKIQSFMHEYFCKFR